MTKISISILTFSLLFGVLLNAQDAASPLPGGSAYSKPGVVNQSKGKGFMLSLGNLSQGQDDLLFNHVNVKVKVPFIHGEKWSAMLGGQYQQVILHGFEPLNGSSGEVNLSPKKIRSSRYSLYLHRSIDQRFYASVKIEASFNGDYSTLLSANHDYGIYRIAGVLGVKKRYDLEHGYGFLFQRSFRKISFYPFFVFNQTFNPKWGIEAVLPASINVRYNIRPNQLILFGLGYQGGDYNMINTFKDHPFLTLRSIQLSASYEQEIGYWTWFFISGGYAMDLSSKLRPGGDIPFAFQDTAGPFFNFGIFIYPSKL